MQVLSREARSLLEPPKPGTVHDKQESEAPRTYRQHHDSYIYRQAAAISFMPVSVLHLHCMQTARPNAPFAAARAGRTRCASRCATSAATSAAACRRGQGRTRATSAPATPPWSIQKPASSSALRASAGSHHGCQRSGDQLQFSVSCVLFAMM